MRLKFLQYLGKRFRFTEEGKRIPETFEADLNFQCNRVIIFCSILSFTWFPYVPIDLKLHPDQPIIIFLRYGLGVAGVLLFITRLFKSLFEKSILCLTLFMLYLEIATAVITAIAGPEGVYVGGFLFIISIIAYIPLRRNTSLKILGLTVLIFFGVSIFLGYRFDTPATRYVYNDIISLTLAATIFIFVLDSIRYNSWSRGKKIEKSQIIIQAQKEQLEEQISLAGEIQNSLLPNETPQLPNANLAFKYIPVMDVGGDFVDILYIEEKKQLGLFVCDVSGHGVAAAFVSSMVKMALNRWLEMIDKPAELLHHIHQSLAGKIGENFVTACVCYIDLGTGRLITSNAGHHPILIANKEGDIRRIDSKGRLLVEFLDFNCTDYEHKLEDGDKIVLYTDGITETFNPRREMLGTGKLCDMIVENIDVEPALMCSNIFSEVRTFAESKEPDDDMSLMIFHYLGTQDT